MDVGRSEERHDAGDPEYDVNHSARIPQPCFMSKNVFSPENSGIELSLPAGIDRPEDGGEG